MLYDLLYLRNEIFDFSGFNIFAGFLILKPECDNRESNLLNRYFYELVFCFLVKRNRNL